MGDGFPRMGGSFLTALVATVLLLGPVAATPSTTAVDGRGPISIGAPPIPGIEPDDEWVEIECSLEVNSLEMPTYSEHPSEGTVEGWVEMTKKPPGETVEVLLEVIAMDPGVWGAPAPSSLFFHQVGTKLFNLTIWLEDYEAPGIDHRIEVHARADSLLGSDGDAAGIEVRGIPKYEAEVEMIEPPGEARPGGSLTGTLQIWNRGTMWSTYVPTMVSNPEGVVDTIEFTIDAEVQANIIKKVPFEIKVAEDAEAGTYQVTIGILAVLQDDSTAIMDTLNVTIKVKASDEASPPYSFILLVAFLVAAPVAISLRRKA
jgi:hypothetical protein